MKYIFSLLLFSIFSFSLFAQYLPGTWSFAYDMTEQRNGHTATLMSNGKLLVTGGWNGSMNTKSAEEYDQETDSWMVVDDMDSIRFQHTATALNNGKVFIAGGWNGASINYTGTEIYDPVSQTFSAGPFMHAGRSGHTATKLNDGKVLIVGGYGNDGNTDIVDLYDPETNTISEVASLHYGRSYHCAVLLNDGKVLVVGGYHPDYGFQMSSVEIYDPVLNVWSEAASMHFIRDYFGATLLSDFNQVFVAGGRFFNGTEYEGLKSAEIYDVSTDTWQIVADIPEGQSYNQALEFKWGTDILSTAVLIPGSTNISGSSELTFSGSYAYDLPSDTWYAVPMFVDGRYFYATEKLDNVINNIIVTGGDEGKIVEIFSPTFYNTIKNQNNSSLKISPNPVSDILNIQVSPNNVIESYELYSASGQQLLSEQHLSISKKNISVSVLPTGMYVILFYFKSGNQAYTSFVKE